MKKVIIREESPDEIFEECLGGDAVARTRILSTDLADARVVVKKRDRVRKSMSRHALQNFRASGAQAAKPFGFTPREAWAGIVERCVIRGESLIDGRAMVSGIDYRGVSKEKRIDARVMISNGVLGQDEDAQADLVEQFFAGKTSGPRWPRRLAVLEQSDRAASEHFLYGGHIETPSTASHEASVQVAAGAVHIGGNVSRSVIVTGSEPGGYVSRAGATRIVESTACQIWRQKLAYLLKSEATINDPAAKFALSRQIEEARAKIEELR